MALKHLKLRGNIYWFQRRIPQDIRHYYGDTNMLSTSLHTSDVREAKFKRDILLGEMSGLQMKAVNPDVSKFRSILKTLERDKQDNPNNWDSAYDLQRIQRKGDSLFIDAYKTVTGKQQVPERYLYSLREAMNDWLNKYGASKSADTKQKVPNAVIQFLKFLREHDVSIASIGKRQVHDYLETLEVKYAQTTCMGFLSRVGVIWDYAEALGHVEGNNPFKGHKTVKPESTNRKQLFTPSELRSITTQIQNESPSMQLIYDICLFTGCRVSEVTKLKKKNLFQSEGVTAIFIEKGKNAAATRTIPLTKDISTRLLDITKDKANDSDIFAIDAKVASRKFSRIKTKYISRDSSKSLHSLRALFSTMLLRAEVDETISSQILGHTRGKTMTYGYYARGSELSKLEAEYNKAVACLIDYIGKD